MTEPTAIDLFCGAGGLSLGFELAGFNVLAGVDNDRINVAVHSQNFPKSQSLCLDLAQATGTDVLEPLGLVQGQLDVLVGGPPCQGFSTIGQRRDGDERNLLLQHFARLVGEVQPRYCVVENVPGLLSGNALDHLHRFLGSIRSLGYQVVEPVLKLNAADFGVPQNRRRLVILGYRRGTPPPEYPAPIRRTPPTVWDAIGDLPEIEQYEDLFMSDTYMGELGEPSRYVRDLRNMMKRLGRKVSGLSGCLRTLHSDEIVRRFAATVPGSCEPVSRFHRLTRDGLSRALRAGTGRGHGHHTAARPIHPVHPRCITVREAARLHSFPDWFEFHPTRWNGFRQVGNSVPPLLSLAIARELKVALEAVEHGTR